MFHVITHAQASAENNSVSNFYYYSAAGNVSGLFVCMLVCVPVCLSVRGYISETTRPIFTKFLCMLGLPIAVTRSCSDGLVYGRRHIDQ